MRNCQHQNRKRRNRKLPELSLPAEKADRMTKNNMEDKKIISIRVIKKLFKEDTDKKVEEKANKILSIAGSIGADYSENTLTKIAKSLYL